MPQEWIVESYDPVHGLGVLVREDTRVSFDGNHWHLSDEPRAPGVHVKVVWRRSKLGPWNTVARLESTRPRAPDIEPSFTVQGWLNAFSATSGRLGGMRAKRLIASAQSHRHLENWAADDESSASSFMEVLDAIRYLAKHDYDFRAHRGWLHDCVWLDDGMDDTVCALTEMLSLTREPPLAQGVDFEGFIACFNAAAARSGGSEQLYVVDRVDGLLVIKLQPSVFEALVAKQLLFAHEPGASRK